MFHIDWIALSVEIVALCLLLLLRGRWKRSTQLPYLDYPSVKNFSNQQKSWRLRFQKTPARLNICAASLLLIAALDPHLIQTKIPSQQHAPAEGIAIYLLLDQSGSMQEPLPSSSSQGKLRFEALREMTKQFVEARPNDLIGLVAFARTAKILCPVTLDHATLLKQLATLSPVASEQENGTAIGYALFKTAQLIRTLRHLGGDKPAYAIKNTVIVMVTDGIQETHPGDSENPLRTTPISSAIMELQDIGVRVYVINLNPEINQEYLSTAKQELIQLSELTGGQFYLADNASALERMYSQIDSLEKSFLASQTHTAIMTQHKVPLFQYPATIGVLSLGLSFFLSSTIFRRYP